MRGRFDVYLDAGAVSWVQAPCIPEATAPKFMLRVTPADPRDRSAGDCENLDFHVYRRGIRVDGACWATVPLPAYPIRQLTVGQWVSQGSRMIWQAAIPLPPASPRSERLKALDPYPYPSGARNGLSLRKGLRSRRGRITRCAGGRK